MLCRRQGRRRSDQGCEVNGKIGERERRKARNAPERDEWADGVNFGVIRMRGEGVFHLIL